MGGVYTNININLFSDNYIASNIQSLDIMIYTTSTDVLLYSILSMLCLHASYLNIKTKHSLSSKIARDR